MTWVYLDDRYPEHPKIDGLSDGAFRLHTSAICYANSHLTDGIIPADRLSRLMPKFRKAYVTELTQRLLWIELPGGTHYEIHDYLDWNKSRAEVEKRRVTRAEAGRKGAGKRWGNE